MYDSQVSFLSCFSTFIQTNRLEGVFYGRENAIEHKISNLKKRIIIIHSIKSPEVQNVFWAAFFNVTEKRDQLYGVEVGQVRVGMRANVTSMNARPSYPIMST